MNKLPEFEFSFTLDVIGSQTGKRFVGDFVYHRPNIRDNSNIAKYRARLDGDLANIDSSISTLHFALAHLRFTLSESPKWWSESDYGMDLYDVNVVLELFKTVDKFEETFNKKIEELDKPEEKESSKGKNAKQQQNV